MRRTPVTFTGFTLSACCTLVASAQASTNVGGPIVANTTWTAAGSPYIVTSSIIIGGSAALTIEPGVVVKFNSGLGMTVGSQAFGPGTVKGLGTEAQPILFTSNSANPQPGQWKDISFSDTAVDATFDGSGNYLAGSILRHCVVEFGGGTSSSIGNVTTSNASPYLEHCELRRSAVRGLYMTVSVNPAPPQIHVSHCNIHDNGVVGQSGGGLYCSMTGGGFDIRDCVIANNLGYSGVGGEFYLANASGAVFTLATCLIEDHECTGSGAGLYLQLPSNQSAPLFITDCELRGNRSTSGSGGGMMAVVNWGGCSLVASGTLVKGNSAQCGGGIYVQGYNACCQSNVRSFSFNNCSFISNAAEASAVGDACGGGIYIQNIGSFPLLADFESCNFVGNSATGGFVSGIGRGGSIYLGSGINTTLDVSGEEAVGQFNTFVNNSADLGEAIYLDMPYAKSGSNDVKAQYACWGGLDPNPTVNPGLIYDFFDDPNKAFVIYPPHTPDEVCVPASGCGPGLVPDCNGNCAPASWIGDGVCDSGTRFYNEIPIRFDCAQFGEDGGDCSGGKRVSQTSVRFRLPLAVDTGTHTFCDHNPSSGVTDWDCGGDSYNGHPGTDFPAPSGTPVVAAASGILIKKENAVFGVCGGAPECGCPTAAGNYVVLHHGIDINGDAILSEYFHLQPGSVTQQPLGSLIQCGEQIGLVGNTGCTTGYHLHFELRRNNEAGWFDPYEGPCNDEPSWWVNQNGGSPTTECQAPKFEVGDLVRVFGVSVESPLNVRGPDACSSIIATKQNGATGTILGGPELCSSGAGYFSRWNVDFGGGLTGWAAGNWLVAGAPGDLNGDGIVGAADLAILLGAWGLTDPIADLDGNGLVGASDLAMMLGLWTN